MTDPVIVLGAGFAGLTAAVELKRQGVPVIVLEAAPVIGGLARSHKDEDGFTMDIGAHFITNRLAASLGLSAECRTVGRYGEAVWLAGRTYAYPFGLMSKPGFIIDALRARLRPRSEESAADVFINRYGSKLTKSIAEPILQGWSGRTADQLAPSVADKVPTSILRTMWLKLAGKLSRRAVAIGYCRELPQTAAVWHVYPDKGIGRLVEALAEDLSDEIRLNTPVEGVIVEDDKVVGVRTAKETIKAQAVFSSLPVHLLPKIVEGTEALDDFLGFRYRPMVFVNLKLEGSNLLPDVITWTPGDEFSFFRLSEATQSMPWLAPEGKTVITADLGCMVGDDIWSMEEESLISLVLDEMEALVPDARQRVLGSTVLRTPLAYPVFDVEYEHTRQSLFEDPPIPNLISVGRNGEFDHLLMEDVYWRTRKAVSTYLN